MLQYHNYKKYFVIKFHLICLISGHKNFSPLTKQDHLHREGNSIEGSDIARQPTYARHVFLKGPVVGWVPTVGRCRSTTSCFCACSLAQRPPPCRENFFLIVGISRTKNGHSDGLHPKIYFLKKLITFYSKGNLFCWVSLFRTWVIWSFGSHVWFRHQNHSKIQ